MLESRQGRVIENVQTPGERIRWIVQTIFGGKQGEAARACGISQGVLSKIVRREQLPGQKVLAAFAAHPRVNPVWLYTGEGEPVVPDEGESLKPSESDTPPTWAGLTLPVTTVLLPGLPQRSPLLLSRLRMPVTEAEASPSRYFHNVATDSPVARAHTEKIAVGDFLLMDPDLSRWINEPRALQGKLVIVKIGDENGIVLLLARVGSQPEGEFLPLTTFAATGSSRLLLRTSPEKRLLPSTQRTGRGVEWDDDPAGAKSPTASGTVRSIPSKSKLGSLPHHSADEVETQTSDQAQLETDAVVRIEDVAAVCVMLIRT